jgi:GAF domain-containing protein
MISALIIPIIHNDKVLGALDLQSNQIKDFTPTQREALAVYGQRVGQTLDRIRIMAQLKADVQTQQKIINGQRKKLQELEQSSRAGFAADTWRTYFDQYGGGTLGFDLSSDTFDLVNAADLTPTLRQALTTDGLVESKDGDQNVLSAPILLRGELLGALSFKLPRGAQANDRQREVITSVVQRLGLALENKRLLQQSQAQANRESKANEVAGVLLSSTDVKTVLQLAAQQFTDALGAVNTHIHLQALELGEKR